MNARPSHTNQQINAVVVKNEALRYFSFFAMSDLKPRLEAIGGGVTMANVSKGKFEKLSVAIPVDPLLESFSEYVQPMFDQIERLSIANLKLVEGRDLLLPKLMSGEVTV